MDYADIRVGDTASEEKVFSMDDLIEFSKLSLDKNPIHLDPEYGKKSIFKDNIVYGLLVSSLISGVLSEKLPGYGTIYISQKVRFIKPVFLGDRCIARVEVLEKHDHSHNIKFDTKVYTGEETEENLVVDGEAVVKKP